MTQKTEGIVLRATKYQESNLLVRVYTKDFGMQDFIIKGYASANSRRKYSYFQPLSIVEVVYWVKPGQEIHKINESRTVCFLKTIQTDPVKVALGLAIVEIVYDCIKQEEGDTELYQLLQDTITALDESQEKYVHFFMYFLIQFTHIMGFAPDNQVENWDYTAFFDMSNGRIFNQNGGNTRLAALVVQFLNATIADCQTIPFSQEEKRIYISAMFQYYHYHIEGFRQPKTIQVFSEVFS
jgi:DNA repair protein RecO (recombination protein O)